MARCEGRLACPGRADEHDQARVLDVDLGDEVSCPECGQTLVISNTDPFELDFAPDDEDDDDDEDEKVEEDGADWEEE